MAVSSSQINLTWNASTDNVAVTGYNIYRDNVLIVTSPTNSHSDIGLVPGTLYQYEVSAFDAASNESGRSAPASATTHQVIVTAGLVAEWRFDNGAGQTLTDYAGGFHGTLGSTSGVAADDPTWTPQGLSFDGGDFVTLPTLPAFQGIDIVFRPSSVINRLSAAQNLFSTKSDSGFLLGNFTGALTDEIIGLQQQTLDGYSAAHRRGWTSASESISMAWHLLQADSRPATQYWNLVFDGVDKANATANTPQASFLAGIAKIGKRADAGGVFFSGSMAYILLYSASRTNQQQAQNRVALTSILAARGILLS
jgi:hypothetical protein